VGPYHHSMACPWDADGRYGFQVWRVDANLLNRQSSVPVRGGPPASELGKELTTHHHKKPGFYEILHRASESDGIATSGRLL